MAMFQVSLLGMLNIVDSILELVKYSLPLSLLGMLNIVDSIHYWAVASVDLAFARYVKYSG